MNKYSFEKAYLQVTQRDYKAVKSEIMQALNINNRASWKRRLTGEIEPKMSEAKAIEEVFAKYGIKKVFEN